MIREELQEKNDSLVVEIRELKQIVKVPRLHYKEIEKADLELLKN